MLGREKKQKGTIAVLDIASGSVGGILFTRNPSGLPKILASIRQTTDFSKRLKVKNLQKNMRNAISEVIAYLKTAREEKPELLLCVFSSPWFKAQTRILKIERQKSFSIEQKLINALIEEEKQTVAGRWEIFGLDKQNPEFVEEEVIKTVLNGYEIENIFGKKVKKIELNLFLSLAQKEILEEVKDAASDYISPSKIKFHTFPFVLFNVLKNIINTFEGAMFIDISGEITDLFIIRNNIIEEIDYFTKGENFFVNKLSESMNTNKNEARAKLKQYERDELTKESKDKIRKILLAASEKWSDLLRGLFKDITADKYLPQTLYFCGPAGRLKELAEQGVSENFSKFTSFGQPLNVRLFSPKSLKYHFEFAKGFADNQDIFLLISSLFANHFLNKK